MPQLNSTYHVSVPYQILNVSNVLATDSSTIDYTNDLGSTGYNIAAVFLFLIMVFGCCNNLLVIVVVGSTKQLRTPMNAILLNLSVSDFTISAFGTPLTFISALNHEWVFGDFLCQAYAFLMTLTGMTAIGTLAAIAIDRYIIISRCFHGQSLSQSSATLTIVCIWVYSLVQATPPLLGWNEYVVEHPGIACSLNWQRVSVSHSSFIVYIFVLGYFLPLIIMSVCYGKVVWIIKKSPKMTGRSTTAKVENRVTWMACAMIVCTMSAWTPYAVVSLIVALGYPQLMGPVSSVCPAIFAKTSVIYNPIIYFFLNSQIRDAMLAKLPKRCQKMTSSDATMSMETRCGLTIANNTIITNTLLVKNIIPSNMLESRINSKVEATTTL